MINKLINLCDFALKKIADDYFERQERLDLPNIKRDTVSKIQRKGYYVIYEYRYYGQYDIDTVHYGKKPVGAYKTLEEAEKHKKLFEHIAYPTR